MRRCRFGSARDPTTAEAQNHYREYFQPYFATQPTMTPPVPKAFETSRAVTHAVSSQAISAEGPPCRESRLGPPSSDGQPHELGPYPREAGPKLLDERHELRTGLDGLAGSDFYLSDRAGAGS